MLFGYMRCSTDEQIRGTTFEEQERIIKGMAMVRGISAYDLQIYKDEGVSGSIPFHLRKGGGAILDIMREGDTVCAAKLDRMFRNARDALNTYQTFKEAKVHLILFDLGADPITGDSGTSKLIFDIMSALADHERLRIRERVQDGKRIKLQHGGHVGGEAPYGWRIIGTRKAARLEEVPEEQAVIRTINGMRETGSGINDILREINASGHKSRTGKPFQFTQIQRIIKRNCHAGAAVN